MHCAGISTRENVFLTEESSEISMMNARSILPVCVRPQAVTNKLSPNITGAAASSVPRSPASSGESVRTEPSAVGPFDTSVAESRARGNARGPKEKIRRFLPLPHMNAPVDDVALGFRGASQPEDPGVPNAPR